MSTTSKSILAIVALVVAIVVVALVLRGHGTDEATPTNNVIAQATVPAATPSSTSSSTTKPMEKNYTEATLKTNMGDIVISFDKTNTPNTVENFIKLASTGFYNGTRFHRIIKDFMIQGGDPLSKDLSQKAMWGTGGPGYQFGDEIKPTNSDIKGTIAMANAGPNTNGSQFFINVADNIFLNGKHTVFGHVTTGYDIVEKISKVETDPSDKPVNDVIIESVVLK